MQASVVALFATPLLPAGGPPAIHRAGTGPDRTTAFPPHPPRRPGSRQALPAPRADAHPGDQHDLPAGHHRSGDRPGARLRRAPDAGRRRLATTAADPAAPRRNAAAPAGRTGRCRAGELRQGRRAPRAQRHLAPPPVPAEPRRARRRRGDQPGQRRAPSHAGGAARSRTCSTP